MGGTRESANGWSAYYSPNLPRLASTNIPSLVRLLDYQTPVLSSVGPRCLHMQHPAAMHAVEAAQARTRHKPSASLGSLYEVLADLDEHQLDYLLQEMNHTGHQNVKVSQAVSALDSQAPPGPLGPSRASVLPSAPDLQRQTSKSQQGKLRLQTAFQRAPSLKSRQTETRELQPTTSNPIQDPATERPRSRPEHQPTASKPAQDPATERSEHQPSAPAASPFPEIHLPKRGSAPTTAPTTASARRPTTSSIRSISAYKRIPRPDFHLPPGITVPDLLQLLETEFLSSPSPGAASPVSPAFALPGHISPSPSISLSPSPAPPGGRTLRRHSSRLDMALDAERNASGIEEIGLGMLEPRGSPSPRSLRGSGSATPVEGFARGFGSEAAGSKETAVLEGIFDVLENR